MKRVVVYGGRFQPPHKGHKASYMNLVDKFGAGNVYMASAEKEQGQKDPFTWEEKKAIAVSMGIPSNNFVKVRNAYSLDLIKEAITITDDAVVILAVSEKDSNRFISDNKDAKGYALKKDGKRAAIQQLGSNPLPVSAGFMYATVTPTVAFSVNGHKTTSATEIRDMYASSNDQSRAKILQDLYDKATPKLKRLFDKSIKSTQMESFLKKY